MFYSTAASRVRQTGLKVLPRVKKTLYERANICCACGRPPAPRGYHSKRALAEWAQEWAVDRDETPEALQRRAALPIDVNELSGCAACASQLVPVWVVPDALLVSFADECAKDRSLKTFAQERMLTLMCEQCRPLESAAALDLAGILDRCRRTQIRVFAGGVVPVGFQQAMNRVDLVLAHIILAQKPAV